jgi:RNA polymerase sigma factor (TIGR02999 family)
MTSLATLIQQSDAGDARAADQLFAALYDELHRLAEQQLRRSDAHLTLGTTTLLHETYLALSGREAADFPDRARFFGYASKVMRGLIVDYVRSRRATKRGGQFEITLIGDHEPASPTQTPAELEHIAEALERLTTVDPRLAQLIDLHFFCGFSLVEIAGLRGVSDRTVQRDWRKARMLLEGFLE